MTQLRLYRWLLLTIAAFPAVSATAGELSERYSKLHPDGGFAIIDDKGLSPGSRPFSFEPRPTGVTEIGLERNGCFGECPMYTVRITSDGRVHYVGESYVSRLGTHTGHIPPACFQTLAELVKEAGVAGFHDTYEDLMVSDMETVYTHFVIDGNEKLISNYANSGPAVLWAIEQLIDKLVAETRWDPPHKPKRKK